MAEKKGFDLSALLRDAAQGMEENRLEYLPFDQIHQDPNNFYSLEGLNELADNISLFGLMDPLRVRPDGAGGYTVTSGHRRRAAIQLLIDSGEEKWKERTPCIVDRGQGTPEFHELKLIFANANTRQRSSAEQSREAARVEELLYQLKEQGYDFPGRMRDHVAEAVQASRTKLARWHAIRANLVPELLRRYDDGSMVEDAAYMLSRFPAEIQMALAEALDSRKNAKMPVGSVVQEVWNRIDDLSKPMPCRAHAGNPDCHNVTGRIVHSLAAPYSWNVCNAGMCCMDCFRAREGCRSACREARDKVKLDKDVQAEEDAKRAEQQRKEQDALQRRISRRAQELLPLCEKAGMEDTQKVYSGYEAASVQQLRKWAAGEFAGKHFYNDVCVFPSGAEGIKSMTLRLGCSLELAMGLPEKTAAAPAADDLGENGSAAPAWRTGTPEADGWYAVKLVFLGKALAAPRCFRWDGSAWMQSDGKADRPIDRAVTVAAWFKLPEEEIC